MARLPILPISELKPIDPYPEIVSPKFEQIADALPINQEFETYVQEALESFARAMDDR